MKWTNGKNRLDRVKAIRNAFADANHLLSDKCLQFAKNNDLEAIENLFSEKRQITAKIRALDRFLAQHIGE